MADPIDARYREFANDLAKKLDDDFNGPNWRLTPDGRKIGFALLFFEFGKFDGGRVNYISNAEREDMIAAVKEWLARTEGRYADGKPATKQ